MNEPEAAQAGAAPPLDPARLLSSVIDAAQQAMDILRSAELYHPDPVVPRPDWHPALESAARRLSAAEDILKAGGFTEQLAELTAKREELELTHRRVVHFERMQLAVEKLVLGKGTQDDVQALLAPNETLSQQRDAWRRLSIPTSALEAFLANCVNLAPADRETARVLRRMFKTACDPQLDPTGLIQHIGADITFFELKKPDVWRRERVLGIRSPWNKPSFVLEHSGELTIDSLQHSLSVEPLKVVFEPPENALTEHQHWVSNLPPARTAAMNSAAAAAHQLLAKQNERLKLPPDPRIVPVLWNRAAIGGLAQMTDDQHSVSVWVELNPASPFSMEVSTIAHEISHSLSQQATIVYSPDGLTQKLFRVGQGLSAFAHLSRGKDLAPQQKRVLQRTQAQEVYASGRAPVPATMWEMVHTTRALLEGSIKERLRAAQEKPAWFVTHDCGRWVNEYLVELGTILAVDPELNTFTSKNRSAYSEGVRQLAAVYKLASPDQRLALERAIVLAGRYSQNNELIQFAATVLTEEEQKFFRSHLEDALADPGLGGLLEAMARANPDTREMAELLRGPPEGMHKSLWYRRIYQLRNSVRPQWVGQALYTLAWARWNSPPGAGSQNQV